MMGFSTTILLYSFAKSICEDVLCYLQATYFDQQFSSTFFLHPEEAGLSLPTRAAPASKSLQRLKRNPSQLSGAQATQEEFKSDTRGGPESEQSGGADEHSMEVQTAEQPHDLADGQQQEEMHLEGRSGRGPAFPESTKQEAKDMHMFSLDEYFLPLKKQPNGQAQHPTLSSPAQDEFLRGSPQEYGDTAMQLSTADAAGREIEEELILTIEEQDQALG